MTQSRRNFLQAAGVAGSAIALGGLAGCLGDDGEVEQTEATEDDPLQVAVYGGFFQEVLDEQLFAPFEEETGIPVESEAQETGETAISQYEGAVNAGEAPVDVAIMSTTGTIRGENSGLWHVWGDDASFENVDYVADDLLRETDDGLVSVGALSWFINLVYNQETTPEVNSSWEALWDPTFENELALLGLASNSFLLDITAVTHFGGQDVLEDRNGVEEVFGTLEEIKPQAAVWYENEADFQQRFTDGGIAGGMFYHDISLVMSDEGEPVESVFADEGSVLDSGSWVTLSTSDKLADAQAFIDYASTPEVQDRVAQNLYTSPTISREHSTLSDEDYELIAGPGPDEAITPKYELYVEEEDWVNEQWNQFIVG
ncbi:ABC transporter substrate-binding protein [Haloferacaceae archaeon DSL9]